MRSNSESTPDNIWGTPGYAAREAWRSFFSGHVGHAMHILWQVFGEPIHAQTYTPLIGDVFRAADREAKRIGWQNIWRFGRIRAIRKTDDGRYAIAYSQSDDQQQIARDSPRQLRPTRDRLPGAAIPAGLAGVSRADGRFRARRQRLRVARPRLRASGAQRRRHPAARAGHRRLPVDPAHLRGAQEEPEYRHPASAAHADHRGHKFRRAQRKAIHHVEIQAFNWPKGTWGGVQRQILEQADEETRLSLYADWGGTTTAQRRDWVRIIDEG